VCKKHEEEKIIKPVNTNQGSALPNPAARLVSGSVDFI
jgi:hypothetical protein